MVEEIPKSSKFRHNSPLVQVSLIGLVDPTAANNALTALYTTFAVFGVAGGGSYNVLGPRSTLLVGCCSTYVLYAGSFLYYNHYHHQGAIMTAYPPSGRKGLYISLFWTLFNLGGVIGGLIPFVMNYNRGENEASVNDGTYIVFMGFMAAGAVLSIAILHPSRVVRDDGSKCTNIKYSSVSVESVEILKLFLNWKMLLLFPAAFASNFFYGYQFNCVNAVMFNLRTRGFNNVFYWGAQMIGSVAIGYVMDYSFQEQEERGLVGIGVVALLGTGIWAGGLVNQQRYSREDKPEKLDFKNSRSDFADAMFQSMVYWVIGALADNSETLSRYSGFYKGVQSAGSAISWQVDKHIVPFMKQLIANWLMTTVSYPMLAVLVMLAVKDEHKTDKRRAEQGGRFASGIAPGLDK
ncbi:hypothetical protein NMG60_11020035 [Bertholletia excelsa]